jgi:thiamine-monophosphate kinase
MPAETGEQALIARIRERLPTSPEWVRVGIGDDAAVVEAERSTFEVLTTDTLVEGIHWDPRFCSPADVGHKSLTVNLSDLAAMGAKPRAALLSLSLPSSWTRDTVDGFTEGFAAAAREHGVAVVGGNITATRGPAVINVTLTGSVRPRRALLRSGARAGDALYVTGSVGAALAGLLWLQDHPSPGEPADPGLAECVRRYRRPVPRVRIGSLFGRNRAASACMDLSDGLADAVRQVAEASGTGARIIGEQLPIPPAAREVFEARGKDPILSAAAGGDDYELLLAVPPRKKRAAEALQRLSRGVPLTLIGEVTGDGRTVLVRGGQVEEIPQGFSHF